jgi:hypothetical protein
MASSCIQTAVSTCPSKPAKSRYSLTIEPLTKAGKVMPPRSATHGSRPSSRRLPVGTRAQKRGTDGTYRPREREPQRPAPFENHYGQRNHREEEPPEKDDLPDG